jgi:peptidoglycan/LPS O-acetylase OafA/YrhL
MTNLQQAATHFADTKPHYALLDGLRGVAALLVVWYHVFEGYQTGNHRPDWWMVEEIGNSLYKAFIIRSNSLYNE